MGLSLGITSALFLIIYVSDELSYDQYHENANRIYRVHSHITETDDEFTRIVAQIPFADQVVLDYPEVEYACRFSNFPRALFRFEETEFIEENFFYTDTTVFDIFSYRFIYGNPDKALARPNDIVISRTIARKYFGDINPVGHILQSEGNTFYEVTGVIEDVPTNSHFRFDALVSRLSIQNEVRSWAQMLVFTYLLLPENVNIDDFEVKMQAMYTNYMAPIFEKMGISIKYELMPIKRIHLYSNNASEPEPTGSMAYVYIFSFVALLLILIASLNYMNLATARSARRAREVGLRKVVGSGRGTLIAQFLMESISLTMISLIISCVLMILLLPNFNQIAGKSFDISILMEPVVLLSIIVLIILVGIVGGSYPAFYLTKFSPIHVIKSAIGSTGSGSFMRKIMVISQFTISIAMIVCTMVVFTQLNHLRNKDQGWDMDQVMVLVMPNDKSPTDMTLLKQRLLQGSNISGVGGTNTHLGEGSVKGLFTTETSEGMFPRGINWAFVDHDFVETMNIEMVEGRDFREDMPTDRDLSVLVNQTLANRMGWEEPLGKRVERKTENRLNANVVGVVKDYHQTGMYNEVESLLMIYRHDNSILYVRLGENSQEAMKFAEEAWNDVFPNHPFNYEFLDQRFEKQFSTEKNRGTVFTLFTALAIFIACLGLFGLASFTVEKRNREISIRRVMGASTGSIIKLISKEFIILIFLSMAIAFPISWFVMQNWLENYVYCISMGPTLLVVPGLITIGLTALTICFQAYKAAVTNPVIAIKNN